MIYKKTATFALSRFVSSNTKVNERILDNTMRKICNSSIPDAVTMCNEFVRKLLKNA